MKTFTLYQFDRAVEMFKALPNQEHFILLTKAALALVTGEQPNAGWKSVDALDALSTDFYGIRVVAGRRLDAEEVSRLSGCLGYALRQVLAGEDLSEPYVCYLHNTPGDRLQVTLLEYSYDSTKSRRDDPDFEAAFELARDFIFSGSPVRQSNRAGAGTKGTRLVEGISQCDLRIYVR